MKPRILCAAFFAFSVILVTGALASDVVELTDSNFWQETGNGQAWFIEFYAPGCANTTTKNQRLFCLSSTKTMGF